MSQEAAVSLKHPLFPHPGTVLHNFCNFPVILPVNAVTVRQLLLPAHLLQKLLSLPFPQVFSAVSAVFLSVLFLESV